MAKVGGGRNFGFGKQMAWAGKQALRERYGDGHYGTVAAHTERWGQFAAWAKSELGLRDARDIDASVAAAYGEALAQKVTRGEHAVAYAQNLLSTINVVMEALRGDRLVRLSPTALVGQRTHVRVEPPNGLDRADVRRCTDHLRAAHHPRVAAVAELARELGLRAREASMLDARTALRQATTRRAVNITAGTKGGRGHRVDRWVPVSERTLKTLEQAAATQGTERNLIPAQMSWRQWNHHLHHIWFATADRFGLGKLHDLRASYACERYAAITGAPAPVCGGHRTVERDRDRNDRLIIAEELGHARIDIVATYIGGTR